LTVGNDRGWQRVAAASLDTSDLQFTMASALAVDIDAVKAHLRLLGREVDDDVIRSFIQDVYAPSTGEHSHGTTVHAMS
jgi:hypothetical protein